MLIEGHTDSKPFASDGGYSNWELSTDRANSARKLMEAYGLRPVQVAQVRGFADRELRHPEDPQHASNRRISVIVQYLRPNPDKYGCRTSQRGRSQEANPKTKPQSGSQVSPRAPPSILISSDL